mmetsp:Transcript_1149/g.1605  ORF Transcript_1149/g.1605 Transcript_1149/m.1605 type:complete len:218 (+) Transcript_1149:128-781(+)
MGACQGSEDRFAKRVKRRAENGEAQAQRELALCYRFGAGGFRIDLGLAFHWFCEAAWSSDTQAQFWLGDCYHHGIGVEISIPRAVSWYSAAALRGNKFAIKRLHGLEQNKDSSIRLEPGLQSEQHIGERISDRAEAMLNVGEVKATFSDQVPASLKKYPKRSKERGDSDEIAVGTIVTRLLEVPNFIETEVEEDMACKSIRSHKRKLSHSRGHCMVR